MRTSDGRGGVNCWTRRFAGYYASRDHRRRNSGRGRTHARYRRMTVPSIAESAVTLQGLRKKHRVEQSHELYRNESYHAPAARAVKKLTQGHPFSECMLL